MAPPKEGLDPELKKMIAEAVAQAVGGTMLELKKIELDAQKQQQVLNAEQALKAAEAASVSRSPCPKCSQPGSACGYRQWKDKDGNLLDNDKEAHEYIRVQPTQRAALKHFQGIRINNVVYDSKNSPNGIVCCPRASQVGAMVNAFENMELEVTQGRMGGAFKTEQASVRVSGDGASSTGNNQSFLNGFSTQG